MNLYLSAKVYIFFCNKLSTCPPPHLSFATFDNAIPFHVHNGAQPDGFGCKTALLQTNKGIGRNSVVAKNLELL